MNKRILLAASFLLVNFFFSGCIKDTVTKTYTYTLQRAIYETKPAVRESIKSDAPQAIEQPGKLVVQGNYIFLNEIDKGVHVIDNSNPAQPKNIAFIAIPGNQDLAIKGNTMYADLYSNLLTLDITDPRSVSVKKIDANIFPSRSYGGVVAINGNQVIFDSSFIVTGWDVKDTTVTEKYNAATWRRLDQGGVIVFDNCPYCDFAAVPSTSSSGVKVSTGIGVAGSMARFAIVGERLYTIGNHESLQIFNITNPQAPVPVNQIYFSAVVETIFPFKDKLMMGAANGMYIYDISSPDAPVQVGLFTHAESCDPVITDGNNAYVTLRTGTLCNGTINQLDVLDVSNVMQPSLLKSYDLTHPQGLSIDGKLLFICDDNAGLKIYDATKPDNLQLLKTFSDINAYDVIANNGDAIVVAKDGLYQFDYSQASNIRQLSKLTLH